MHSLRTLASVALIAVVGLLGGCRGEPKVVDYARDYPALRQGETVNIQVFRRPTEIELTNTTARAFGPCTLWLNARYSRPLDGLGVGQTLVLPLAEFRDINSEAFRGGGFFATDTPDRLVLAQIETKDDTGASRLLGLIVVSHVDDEAK
ncbi:MAG: hypothetical protein HUU18_06425 [Phycisphaerales bacterium]|nr:hypothetical protein [Phycisphaerales bacterium]